MLLVARFLVHGWWNTIGKLENQDVGNCFSHPVHSITAECTKNNVLYCGRQMGLLSCPVFFWSQHLVISPSIWQCLFHTSGQETFHIPNSCDFRSLPANDIFLFLLPFAKMLSSNLVTWAGILGNVENNTQKLIKISQHKMRVARMRGMRTLERNDKDLRVITAAVSLALVNHGPWQKKKVSMEFKSSRSC